MTNGERSSPRRSSVKLRVSITLSAFQCLSKKWTFYGAANTKMWQRVFIRILSIQSVKLTSVWRLTCDDRRRTETSNASLGVSARQKPDVNGVVIWRNQFFATQHRFTVS
ncbi:Hypothetical_protein [Hexamita inflata]|uniref:Hypothetical_protein n=1 Tax=Hexamita inflata TaxID=28002 RepID=A0AA86R9S4_9EUKA|nr:Hypothetical protein HINF_LOCUS57626 [Hexamita inflata]